ncbi:BTB/POZ domain-containing protein POB1 [Capsicum annuum]|uniref:BTB/POZ domain-containing protein POB1 n=1 Tax=Capsicum annuum TaxID=4072 RepID=A0A2G3ADL7_CAPAN|nr:BTB/POZ domain-containing protein POB1 [Capsicum annuum]
MAANKFEVESCMRYCSLFLQKLNMTTESALVYLSIPFNESMANAVWPLTDAAKQFLARRYRNITRFQEEVLRLPLWGIEVVLSSDNLHIASEDDVHDFAVKWAHMHYPSLEERRKAFRLGRQGFFLSAHCERDQQNAVQCFGLYLGMQEKGLESLPVDFKFAVRISPVGNTRSNTLEATSSLSSFC